MRMLKPDQFLRELRNMQSKFETELFRARQEIGTYAVNHFQSSFSKGGFAGGGSSWRDREHSYSHKMLDKTGSMKEAINFRAYNTSNNIVVSATKSYARFHNDPDGSWARNQHTSKTTLQRQFIGNSRPMELWIKSRLQAMLTNTFR